MGEHILKRNSIIGRLHSVLLALLLIADSTSASHFKIAKVIELPKESYQTMWSPDGSKIALMARNYDTTSHKIIIPALMLIDTLGRIDSVTSFGEVEVHRWAWLSPDEIVLHSRADSARNTIHRLLRFTISDKSIEEIKAYRNVYLTTEPDSITKQKYPWMYKDRQVPDGPMFDGPFDSGYNNLYIIHDNMNLFGEYRREQIHSKLYQSIPDSIDWLIAPTKQGVYAINTATNDSVLLTSKIKEPAIAYGIDLLVSKDHRFVVRGEAIVETADDKLIFLDSMFHEIPKGTAACGYLPLAFNPVYPELIFRRDCDDGHNYGVGFVATINLSSYKWEYLDYLPHGNNITAVTYSPDGTKFTYCFLDSLYLVQRETQ